MTKVKRLSILLLFCLLFSLVFPMTVNKVYAGTEDEVTLNFEGGVIGDDYVEYSGVGKLQLFRDDELVTNISNGMKIDLEESSYQFVIDDSSSENTIPTRIIINELYYSLDEINSKKIFKLEPNKYYDTLTIKLEKKQAPVNTRNKTELSYYKVTETIDLSKEYVIDFSKNDDLTQSLKIFADLDKTLYYKSEEGRLAETENENDAIIKIVGNKNENNAVITAVNVGNKKEENVKGIKSKYIGSTLEYGDDDKGIINMIKHNWNVASEYDFTFKYVNEEVAPKEYKVVEGANQTYMIDKSKNATFRIDVDYSLFTNKVYVDDKLVEPANYDSKSGSTVITLKDEYLKTLSVGEHTLKVAFSDNGEAITKFTIKEKQQDTNIEDNKNIENTKNEEKQGNNNLTNNDVKKDNTISSPKTGDNVIEYFVIFSIAVLGIVTLVIVNTKRKN